MIKTTLVSFGNFAFSVILGFIGIAAITGFGIVGLLLYAMYFEVPPGKIGEGGSILDSYFYQSHGPSESGLEFVITCDMDGYSYEAYIYDPDQCGRKPGKFVSDVFREGSFVWSLDNSVVAFKLKNRFMEAYDFRAHKRIQPQYKLEYDPKLNLIKGTTEANLRQQDQFINELLLRRGGGGRKESCDLDKARGINQWSIDRNYRDGSCLG